MLAVVSVWTAVILVLANSANYDLSPDSAQSPDSEYLQQGVGLFRCRKSSPVIQRLVYETCSSRARDLPLTLY